MRLAQKSLIPAALLLCLFFYETAYSEKKNSSNVKGSGKNFYNENKKKQTGNSGDITSYNKKTGTYIDDEESNDKTELIREESANLKEKNKNIKSNPGDFKYYIIKKGDTLFSIAKRSQMSLKSILETNNLTEKSSIHAGMKLKIPCSKTQKNNVCNISGKASNHAKPLFLWPLKKIKSVNSDGKDGVKSIGIIIRGNSCSEVLASEKGIVKRVGYMRGYGRYIVLNHENRYMTVYSNLIDVNVKVGETVQRGMSIGNISSDMTLHFQIDHQGKPENPLKLLPGKS